MKIVVVIPNVTGGGAERATALLVNHWVEHHDVSLVCVGPAKPDAYEIDARAHRVELARASLASELAVGRADRIPRLRRLLASARPDIVVSVITVTNLLTLVAARGLRIPVIVAEHSDPREHKISRFWKFVRDRTYRRAAVVVVVSPQLKSWLSNITDPSAGRVIPGPVVVTDAGTPPRDREKRVIAVGRLVHEKGFDILLDAFARTRADHPQWTVEILGQGPEKENLLAQARRLGIESDVALRGWVPDVQDRLARSEIFVLSSRQEAQGLALIEAMANGLAVVAFDCPIGPRDIVTSEVDGLLVPPGDAKALATAINRLMDDAELRRRLGHAAKRVVSRYHPDSYLREWDALLASLDPAGDH